MRHDKRIDHVSILIDEKLRNLPPRPQEHCIFKVHHKLRQVNEKAYEPQILAIGPYHRGKDSVQVMEEHKLHYLRLLLERSNENSVDRLVVTLRGLEERARNCYAESVCLSVDEFVEMMLLDGCFIIELLHKIVMKGLRDRHDPIFNLGWIYICKICDIMLFDNQLPFFVLSELFNMTKDPNLQFTLTHAAVFLLAILFPPSRGICYPYETSSNEIKHFLELIHNTMIPSFAEVGRARNVVYNWTYIHSATELKEAGVKFKKGEGGNLFDIKFKNGVMEVPTSLHMSNIIKVTILSISQII